MRLRIILRIFCLALATCVTLVQQAVADDSPDIIRDAEIENTIRTYATPIFIVAGLDPKAVHIYIINDPTLNSFVAGGQNLFMNTGTLMRADRPNEIIGIMAHETGHIAGGHLARFDTEMHNATLKALITMAVGVVAAAAGRSPDAAAAGMAVGMDVGEHSYLSFSVAQEGSADQAGLGFLDKTHQSAKGLLDFFEILEQEEFLSAQHQDPYLRTHPLTRQRIEYVRKHVEQSPWSNVPDPPQWVAMYAVLKAKLGAFLNPPSETLDKYKADDSSVPARYARAIAYYKVPQLNKALDLINGLIHDYPDNPYFYELKGQMLFENGHVADAVEPYQKAVQLKPDTPLLRVELGQVELETEDPALVPKALNTLADAVHFENENPDAWHFLAIAYGRSNNLGMAALALAEEGMVNGDYKTAGQQATRALQILPPGQNRVRAQDIQDDAKRQRDKS
ncbi:MAG TPA: M48 family metalloprotease [Stellaceae bacterium]|nr:M48 family metalloprotease [Stellaceae bacterium]